MPRINLSVFVAFDISCVFKVLSSVEHAYFGSNVRALVLLSFIGNLNKQQIS